MKLILSIIILFSATEIYADDHIMLKYHSGYNMSGRVIEIRIDKTFDRSGTLIKAVYQKLEKIQGLRRKSYDVPDAPTIMIKVEYDNKMLESSSFHTIAESNKNIIASATGVSFLKGISREEELLKEPKDFLEFRRLWEEALNLSLKIVEDKFKP